MNSTLAARRFELECRREDAQKAVNDARIPAAVTDDMKQRFFETEFRTIDLCDARLRIYRGIERFSISDSDLRAALRDRIKPDLEKRIADAQNKLKNTQAQLDEVELILEFLSGNCTGLAFA